jgi:exopolysaccharide production protein ExoZ
MPVKKEPKILSVQYLRGLAALGVVLCHYGSSLTLYPKLSSFFNFGQTGVFVFFLVSGFIIVYSLLKSAYKPSQFLRFLLKRSIRIDPPYICTILLTIIFFGALALSKGEPLTFSAGRFFAHIFYVVPFTRYPFYNHAFWTLCVEFQFYLVIGLLYFLNNTTVYRSVFLVVFGLTCLIPFFNAYYLVFNYAPIFALGISLVTFYENRNLKNAILPTLLLCLTAYKFGLPIAALLLISSLIILFFKYVVRPLIFLGNISYSVYLIHDLVLIFFVGIGKILHFEFAHYQLIWLLIETLAAIFCAWVFYIFIEKPSIKFSKRVFYNRRAIISKE